jgi:hypothetical protein
VDITDHAVFQQHARRYEAEFMRDMDDLGGHRGSDATGSDAPKQQCASGQLRCAFSQAAQGTTLPHVTTSSPAALLVEAQCMCRCAAANSDAAR